METIMEIAQSIGIPGNNLLTEWYALDTNAMPQHYVLQVHLCLNMLCLHHGPAHVFILN